MRINLTESEYHLVAAALQEYGTSWMAVVSEAMKNTSRNISMAKEKGDAVFALLKKLRKAKAEESGSSDSA